MFGLNGRFFPPACLWEDAARMGYQDGPAGPREAALVLIAPSTAPCLRRAWAFTVQSPGFPSSFPREMMILSGVSKSCRSMAPQRATMTTQPRDKAEPPLQAKSLTIRTGTKTCHLALDSKHGIYRASNIHGSIPPAIGRRASSPGTTLKFGVSLSKCPGPLGRESLGTREASPCWSVM